MDDESLRCGSAGSVKLLEQCNAFVKTALDEHNNTSVNRFSSWICTELTSIVKHANNKTLDKDQLWSSFHALRSSKMFDKKWEEFLSLCKMPTCPLFYQHFTAKLMEHTIKQQIVSVPEIVTDPQPSALGYEEQNAVRYVAGYIIRNVRQHLKSPQDDELLLALKDLCNTDDDTEPAESEEWLCTVDRGGLVRVTDDAYTCFTAIEYCIQRHFRMNNLHKMNETFREKVAAETKNDDDVQFYWCLLSGNMDQECSEKLLELLINKYITIRGFSFAKSLMEIYKKDTKKGTQKAKSLRRKVAESTNK